MCGRLPAVGRTGEGSDGWIIGGIIMFFRGFHGRWCLPSAPVSSMMVVVVVIIVGMATGGRFATRPFRRFVIVMPRGSGVAFEGGGHIGEGGRADKTGF